VKTVSLISIIFLLCWCGDSHFAQDWTQWRGANRDGVVKGFTAPATWPKAIRKVWQTQVGIGHSTPLVVGEKVYVFARQGEDEVLSCLELATGKELWRVDDKGISYKPHEAAVKHGKGPKATPVYHQGRIYTLGISGILAARDAANGKLIWRKDFAGKYPKTSPLFGAASSPVIEKNLLIAAVGGHDKGALIAFDAKTGAEKWAYDQDGPAYASPVVVTLAGVRQVVTFTQKELVSVDAANGKLLWKRPAKSQYDENCVTVLPYKDTLIVGHEENIVAALRVVKKGANYTTETVWQTNEHYFYMSSPVVHGKTLLGFSAKRKGQLVALDADTGKTLWTAEGRQGENAALLNAGHTLFALNNDAQLFVLNPAADKFAPLIEYAVAESPTWAHPVIVGKWLFVKDENSVIAWKFEPRNGCC
jgi:outer membrane protein assembly factor BamB